LERAALLVKECGSLGPAPCPYLIIFIQRFREHFVQFFVERVLLGSGVPENSLDFHLFHIKIFEFFVPALFLFVI
jgi:hypothetical protein